MSEVDRYYETAYTLPLCSTCGGDWLTFDTYMVYKVKLFCANENCTAFLKCYWVDKKDLEKR